jgi:hypothetical protein
MPITAATIYFRLRWAARELLPVGIFAAGWLYLVFIKRRQPAVSGLRASGFAAAWLGAALAGAIAPLKFWDHYFLMLAPPLALLAGLAIAEIAPRIRVMAVLGLIALELFALRRGPGRELTILPGESCMDCDTARAVGDYLHQHMAPGDMIYVVNYQPYLYLATGSRVPTRYVLPAELAGPFRDSSGADPALELPAIFSQQPVYVVVLHNALAKTPAAVRNLITGPLSQHYRLEAAFEDHTMWVPDIVELYRRVS